MKTYRIYVYEVNEAGEVGPLVDIVECQAEPIPSGQNVFHLVRFAFAILLDHYGAPGQALVLLTSDRWELTTEEIESALERIRVFRTRSEKEGAWKQST